MPEVKLYANLRKTAGVDGMTVDGMSVLEVVNCLVEKIPALRPALLEAGELRQYVTIAVNGHNIDLNSGLDTPVKPDDQIAIFPPIAGG